MIRTSNNFKSVLSSLQDNLKFIVDKESLENTPDRLARMYENELLIGYSQDPNEILSKVFKSKSDDMVIIKNIPFVSLCSHHWLPFIGKADVAYIPKDNKIVGLSKIPRLVQCFARRFQIQENMTTEIADSLFNILEPKGCIVVTKAVHMCAQIRGVQSKDTEMIVSSIRGCFEEQTIREEFLELVKNGSR